MTLNAATRHGIRWFDTAPLYGHGLAEKRLGDFLGDSRPSDIIVSTKVGRLLESAAGSASNEQFVDPAPYRPIFDYSASGVERSYEDSLKRLQLQRVQLLLLHDIDRVTHRTGHRDLIRQVLDEALPTLHRLKSEKRVDAVGLGINEWDVGFEILASAEVDCVLVAGRYTLLDSSAFTSGFLDACFRRGVSVLAGGVFNSGFLAGGSHYDYRPASVERIAQRSRLTTLCQRFNVSLPAAAVRFSSSHPAISCVLLGARTAAEVEAFAQWGRAEIPETLWAELRREGFLPDEAPTPSTSAWNEPACA